MSTVPRTSSSTPSKKAADSKQAAAPDQQKRATPCAHPRVQVVSRNEDAEYVECLECREVFESSEFQDMAIEEKIEEKNNGETE
jgi:hypothetical protein